MQTHLSSSASSRETTGAWIIWLIALLVVMLAQPQRLSTPLQPQEAHAQSRGRRGGDGGKRASCVTAYGKTACGFDCKAAYGEVKCAQTAKGTCSAGYGQITCWDPQTSHSYGRRDKEYDGGYRGGGRRVDAQSTCESAYGTTACGYGCVAAYGTIKCAQTPGARCLAAYGQIACGFNCEAAYGSVKCASTPHGTCVASSGTVQCYDPR